MLISVPTIFGQFDKLKVKLDQIRKVSCFVFVFWGVCAKKKKHACGFCFVWLCLDEFFLSSLGHICVHCMLTKIWDFLDFSVNKEFVQQLNSY